MFAMTNKKGFTLAELLIAILILSILSVAGTYTFAYSQKRARDTQRLKDLDQIKKTLELVKQDCTGGNYYPATPGATTPTDPYDRFLSLQAYLSGTTLKYMNSVPQDPKNTAGARQYKYFYSSTNVSSVCPDTAGGRTQSGSKVYVITAKLENLTNTEANKAAMDSFKRCATILNQGFTEGWMNILEMSGIAGGQIYAVCSQ